MKKNGLHKQRGMTLLELLAALAVGALLFIGLADLMDTTLEQAKGDQAAFQQLQTAAAAARYLEQNYATLRTSTASATVGVSVADLRTAGLLSSGFADTNSYGQRTCLLVRQPSAGRLEGLLVTYGGQPIAEKNIAMIAMNAGVGGGYLGTGNPRQAKGMSWSMATNPYWGTFCGAQVLTGNQTDAGHLISSVFYAGPGSRATEFIYRDEVPGQPELNRMNTPLGMAANALQTADTACGTQPAIAINRANGHIMACLGGLWKSYATASGFWKDPVANFTTLAGTAGTRGDARVTLDTGRAFVFNGTAWRAIGVDQNGDFNAPRNITAGNNITADGNMHTKDLVATGNVDVTKQVTADGVQAIWMNSRSYEITDQGFKIGESCNTIHPNGSIESPTATLAREINGHIIFCNINGTFTYLNGSITTPPFR